MIERTFSLLWCTFNLRWINPQWKKWPILTLCLEVMEQNGGWSVPCSHSILFILVVESGINTIDLCLVLLWTTYFRTTSTLFSFIKKLIKKREQNSCMLKLQLRQTLVTIYHETAHYFKTWFILRSCLENDYHLGDLCCLFVCFCFAVIMNVLFTTEQKGELITIHVIQRSCQCNTKE